MHRPPGMVEREDHGQRRAELAATHRTAAADREQVDRLPGRPGHRRHRVFHEGAVLRLCLEQDRLRLGADRCGHHSAVRVQAQLLKERQLPVHGGREGGGARPGDAQRVGGAPDGGPAGEGTGLRGAPGDEGHGDRRHLRLDRRADQGALVDRRHGIGRAPHLEVREHIGEPALVHHPADVAVPAEGGPESGAGRILLMTGTTRRAARLATRAAGRAQDVPCRLRGLLLEHLRGAQHGPDGRHHVARELPEEAAPVGIGGRDGAVGHETGWGPGDPCGSTTAAVSTG